jgi:hypothetical protein
MIADTEITRGFLLTQGSSTASGTFRISEIAVGGSFCRAAGVVFGS